MATLAPVIKQRFFDANGDPLAGGKVYTYTAGTSTPKATYADETGVSANANPVILDANGYADIWLGSGSYKFVLKDSNDVTQYTVDNIESGDVTSNPGSAIKARVATTTALTLLTGIAAGSVVDGVTLVAGDVVLVKNQAASKENGVYTVQASTGSVVRGVDANTWDLLVSALVAVSEGTTNSGTLWQSLTAEGGTLETTAITFQQVGTGSGGAIKALIATTANITLSGEQTIDGVLTSSSVVLVKNQSTDSQNGVYTSGSGSWTRYKDANTWAKLVSAIVAVEQGTISADTLWYCTSNSGGTLGSTSVTFSRIPVTVPVTIAQGGTGQATQQLAIDALTGSQSSGKYLRSDGTHATLSSLAAADLTGTVASSKGGTGQDFSASTGYIKVAAGTMSAQAVPIPIADGGTNAITQQLAIDSLTGSQTNAKYLRSDGTHATLSSLAAADLTGTVASSKGGTGQDFSASTGYIKVSSGTMSAQAVPIPIADGGTNGITATAAFNNLAPTTTRGDIITRGAANNQRVALGTRSYALRSDGTDVNYYRPNPINYILNYDAEVDASVWATFADAAASTPVDGTGGAPSSTWTRSTSSPLREVASFLWTKSANNRQGEGISYDFTIDAADKGKVLQITFDFAVVSGSTYADSDMTVWIYDVSNSTLIQPAPYQILNSGINERWYGEFQTVTSSTSYRLIIYTASTSANAYTLKFDNFQVGPYAKLYGSPITDWVAWTPTGSWSTNTTYTGFYRRIGDHLEADVMLTLAGAPTSANLSVNLPTGLSMDTTKLLSTQPGEQQVGHGDLKDNGTAYYADVWAMYNTTTSVAIYSGTVSATSASAAQLGLVQLTQAAPITFASGDKIQFRMMIPIAGWGNTVLMSNDASNRVIVAEASGKTPTGTLNGSYNIVKFGTTDADNTASYASGSGLFTAPVSGYYHGSAIVDISHASVAASNSVAVAFQKNGSGSLHANVFRISVTSPTEYAVATSGIVQLNAGDTLAVVALSSGTTPAYNTTLGGSCFSIMRVSGPAQIAAVESVNVRYYACATSISGSLATLNYTSRDYDSHAGYNSGTYTVPVSGKYLVKTAVAFTAGSAAAGNALNVQIQKNGTVVSEIAPVYQSTQILCPVFLSDTFSCVAGDTIRVQASSAATSPALTSSNSKNYLSIERVGN